MSENIKVRWLTDHEQTKIAPKTLSTQIMNEDGTRFKDTVESAIVNAEAQTTAHASNNDIHVTAEEKEAWNSIEVPSLDGYATEEYVESLVKKLSATLALSFYCIEDVTVITNGISKVYPANSSVEIVFSDEDVFEIVPTSNESILSLTAFPGALGTFYPWLEGVAQFSNILFDMNDVDFYSKWSQGNQGAYHVQKAQYTNCIFWSDNPYVSDVSKRTNYTLTHTSQLPLCYSSIPDNTFKSFYLAFGVNSDPNWGNRAYLDSFAKATWATQVFSYYGARTIGIVGHDDPDFNIVLPKDCRGLMFDARHIENAGTFDAINTTNFGAKSGSWREAFGFCPSLKRLYIKNLKVNLNISWSPIDYDSISYIISAAANTNAITISVSPYTYNLLSPADFTAAADKNITIALITTNYVEDRRLGQIANKADKEHTHDDRYYTESEVDSKLSEKADSTHTHTEYMTDTNPVGAGSFSMNRKVGTTVGTNSTAEGNGCAASGNYSHAEGNCTTASGDSSHAEGSRTATFNVGAHAEGYSSSSSPTSITASTSNADIISAWNTAKFTLAKGLGTHAEGTNTLALGQSAHAEGQQTTASSIASHAEGRSTTASGDYSHAEGDNTSAQGRSQHVQGEYSIAETNVRTNVRGVYAHIVGNGTATDARSNAHTLDWDGNAWFAGDVYVGSTSGTNKDEGSKKLATEEYVDENITQSDWNQNDETALDYVKNRTHYAEPIELLTPTALTSESGDGDFVCAVDFEFQANEKYVINYNGTDYTCVAWEQVLGNDLTITAIGNGTAIGKQDTGEPFIIYVEAGSLWISSYEGDVEVTIGISILKYNKLDKRYIPAEEISLSAFKNDLYYPASRRAFLAVTKEDMSANDTWGTAYIGTPKLDLSWIKYDPDTMVTTNVGYKITYQIGNNDPGEFNETMLAPKYTNGFLENVLVIGDANNPLFIVVNGSDFDADTDEPVTADQYICIASELLMNATFTIEMYELIEEKKIPADVVDIEIPTKVSELTNDSGFIMAAEIPTKVSELTNDSGFITAAEIPASLPNPNALTFTGAVTGTYDGSSTKTVNIPEEIDRNFLVMLLNDMALGLDISNKLNSFREAMNVQKHGVIKEDDGHSYCYVNGTVQTVEGLTWYDKSHLIYIGASDNGALAAGEYTLSEDKCLPYGFTHGSYDFGNDGCFLFAPALDPCPCQYFAPETTGEIVEIDGILYYYENGVLKQNAGIVRFIEGIYDRPYYIYVKPDGQLATGIYWPTTHIIPAGTYNFGNNGVLPICNVCYKFTNVISDYDYLAVVKNNGVMMTLTPTSGQAISSVVVTMGGVDVTSSVYSDGVINISDVIGDIVVTATAE